MVELIWQPQRLPRSTMRCEWASMERGRRLLQRKLREDEQTMMAQLREEAHKFMPTEEMIAQIRERLINPPVVLLPEPADQREIHIGPGGVSFI